MMSAAQIPPSALPGISPTREEITMPHTSCLAHQTTSIRNGSAALYRYVTAEAPKRRRSPISPRVGEMPGRAEGGGTRAVRGLYVH
ncbi:hypothetical protein RHI9324_03904 [Rhizobium sp. CECT 9324]|nr:hypothetical protein RHI9324_03904 [Rhizobium sp. CECT 9324]